MNNCVGRGNSNHHMIFVFYVWLDTFLLGWISMSSIGVRHCDTEHINYDTPCYYEALCLGCNNAFVHYLVTVGDMIICFFFMAVTTWPMIRTWINYCKGETSNERFARTARTQSAVSELDSITTYDKTDGLQEDGTSSLLSNAGRGRKKKGCWLNCKSMCCNKRVVSQDRLLQIYLAEAADSSVTSLADE